MLLKVIPNEDYGKRKTIKSSYERRTEELLQQLSTDVTAIYAFSMTRRVSQRVQLNDRWGRPRFDRSGNVMTEVRVTHLQDKFYSRNEELLRRYYNYILARFGTATGTTVDWLGIVNVVDREINRQIDDRILQTTIDSVTQIETVARHVPFQ